MKNRYGGSGVTLSSGGFLAWLYSQTHDTAWRDKHDVLFIGGVQGADLGYGKRFNQSYQRSFQGLTWRKG